MTAAVPWEGTNAMANGSYGRTRSEAPGARTSVREDARSTSEKATDVPDPNYMNSLARGLAVILAFTPGRRSLSISQVSQRTGIPRAAARRCLLTLEQLGFVESEEQQFVLRPRVLTLGHAYLATTPLGRAAKPVLRSVCRRINESVSVGILDNDQVLYIARASAERLMVINLDVGSRLPADCTSIGRVMLSHLGPEALEGYLARVPLVRYTAKTAATPEALRDELTRVRELGYALVDEELEIGLRTIAVPTFNEAGEVVAGLSVGAHVARQSNADLTERILPILREAAAELSLVAR